MSLLYVFRTTLRPWLGLMLAVCFMIEFNMAQRNDGFAVINSPQPGTPVHDNIVISVDVTANGKLLQPSAIDSLEIYLVSLEKNLNLTVTTGPGFLEGEPSSTVKHLNFRPPACATDGPYNLTFYEASHTGDNQYLIVSAVLVTVDNTGSSDTRCDKNIVMTQPQPSSPPPRRDPILPPSPNPMMTAVTAAEIQSTSTTASTTSDIGPFFPISKAHPRAPSALFLGFVGVAFTFLCTLFDKLVG